MFRKVCLGALAAALLVLTASADDKKADGFVSLFNGKNLKGWDRHAGTAVYTVEDGCIVGRTSEGSANSFLCTARKFGDFELTFQVKVDDALNSGVQIRSRVNPDTGRVQGPQVEIATNGTAGFIYGEGLSTGWLSGKAEMDRPEAKAAFKKGEWNSYRVVARGSSIKTWVNNVPVADTTDDKTKMTTGFIGLQVHGIRDGTGPFEVRWRNLQIKELK